MAETTPSTNNKSVKFHGKAEHELAQHKKRSKGLRKQAAHMRKRGMISEKQAAKMGMDDAK
jgi:hypothetical protein